MAVKVLSEANPMWHWDSERLLRHLEDRLPLARGEDPKSLRREVLERIRRHDCNTPPLPDGWPSVFNGVTLVRLLQDTSAPWNKMENHPVFQHYFVYASCRETWDKSQTAIRKPLDFLKVELSTMVVNAMDAPDEDFRRESTPPQDRAASLGLPDVYREEGKRLFEAIGCQRRHPAYDAVYDDEAWCISSGHRRFPGIGGQDVVLGAYVCPMNWTKFGIRVEASELQEKCDGAFPSHWIKCYHGTNSTRLEDIMQLGLIPRDPERDPVNRGTAGAPGKGTKPIYLSPCIEYAAHWIYGCRRETDGDGYVVPMLCATDAGAVAVANGPEVSPRGQGGVIPCREAAASQGDIYVQFVFEALVKPEGIWKVQGNTLHPTLWPKGLPYDVNFPGDGLELLVPDAESVIVTGLMARCLREHPIEYNKRRQREMQAHVGWSPGIKRRDHGGERDQHGLTGPVKWQRNADSRCTLARGHYDDTPWQDYAPDVSAMIERAYQKCQRYCFIGEVAGTPYFVDFGQWSQASAPNLHPHQYIGDKDRQFLYKRRAVRRISAAAGLWESLQLHTAGLFQSWMPES